MMKKILMFSTLLLCFFAGYSQKTVKEGSVEFSMTYTDLPKDLEKVKSTLPGSITMYFKNNKFKTEMKMVQGSINVLFDESKKDMTMLMEMMGQKMKIKLTEEQLKAKQNELLQLMEIKNLEIKSSTDVKTIAGYECNKYVISYESKGVKQTTYCYVTDKLPTATMLNDNPIYSGIKGFMMEYQTMQQGVSVQIKAIAVKDEKLTGEIFEIPEGYRDIDPEMLRGR